jgi:tetratricopeptide (TPR) repeat protein
MAKRTSGCLALAILLSLAPLLPAQQAVVGDPPTPVAPLRPQTRQELDRREARKLFGLALLQQREDRLLEAVHTLEEALKLDPEAAALHRALIPLYLALCRSDDALNACRKALEQDPADYATWFVLARQLREHGQPREALAALQKGVACPGLKEHPEQLVQMYFDLGAVCEEAGELAQAEAAFGEVVKILNRPEVLLEAGPFSREQIDAEAAKTYERIGRVCIQAKRFDRAEAAFRQAQARDRERAGRLNYNLAEVSLAQNKLEQALKFLSEYLKLQPPGTEAYETLISLLSRMGRTAEVLPVLRGYAGRDPHNIGLQLLLARQYSKERQWDEAENQYLKLAGEGPTPEVYRGLFALYKDQDRADKVLDSLDTALATAGKEAPPGNAEATAAAVRARAMLVVLRDDVELVRTLLPVAIQEIRARRERTPETRRFLAVLAGRARQLDAAEELYYDCLRRVTPLTEAEIYGGLLDVLWEGRKLNEIARLCREGLEKAQATNRAMFHVNLAQALVQLGNNDEAVAQADKAVDLADDRNRFRLRRLRVNILTQAERYEQAVAECQELLKEFTQPGEVRDTRYLLSNVYSAAKDYAKAEQQLRKILEADPEDATANNDLGYIMADQGKNLEEAEKLIRKAVELDLKQKKTSAKVRPDDDGSNANAAYLDSLGWVLFRRGQIDAARTWLEKAASLPGGAEDPVVWDHLGDVYFRLEQPAKARAAWGRAVELYEKEKRRKLDDHYKELKNKLKLPALETHQR